MQFSAHSKRDVNEQANRSLTMGKFASSFVIFASPFVNLHLLLEFTDDGEINFWWDTDGLYVDLGFFGDGFYSFYAKLPNGKEIIVDASPISEPLPPELLRFLEKSA